MMQVLDGTPEVLGWASETFSIPYFNPLTKKWSMYIPDFLVAYVDKTGKQNCEMIEIKPAKEHPEYAGKVSKQTKLVQAINAAKWQAAMAYCARRKWRFRVATENDLFAFKRKK